MTPKYSAKEYSGEEYNAELEQRIADDLKADYEQASNRIKEIRSEISLLLDELHTRSYEKGELWFKRQFHARSTAMRGAEHDMQRIRKSRKE